MSKYLMRIVKGVNSYAPVLTR